MGFHHLLGNCGGGGGAVVGFGLIELALAFLRGGGQIAIFKQCKQLSLADMIAAIDVESTDGRADFGYDGSLVARIQDAVGFNQAADGSGAHFGGLDWSDWLGFLFFFLGACGG